MSQVCREYTVQVITPIAIELSVEMTDAGIIDHIDGGTFEDTSPLDDLKVMRAILFLTPAIQRANEEGHLIEDLYRQLPEGDTWVVERSILAALVTVQRQAIMTNITKGRAA